MLIRSGIVVACFTLLSRIFGLIRELVLAYIFGTSYLADAINIALKLPNLFRRIFGEGALATVFIPIFNTKLLISNNEAKKFSGEILGLLSISLIILIVILEIFMPSIMMILAPGFYKDHEKFNISVLLCRITLPYLILISITALFGSVLNALKKFASFAFVHVILSVAIIIGSIIFEDKINSAISISYSVIIAGILQVLFMLIFLKKSNMHFSIRYSLNDPEIKKFLKNMLPATLSASIYQLNIFISQSIASFVPGVVSILSYADRIYQFPLSIIGITFGTILLPELSAIYKSQNYIQAQKLQNKAIKIGLFLSTPAMLGIILLAHPIIHIIYERGAFSHDDTLKTAQAIIAFSTGLPAFVLSKILMPIFYANDDTKTPFKITIYCVIINTLLNLLLMSKLQHTGIALSSSIASWIGVILLYKFSKKFNFNIILDKDIKIFMFKLILSSIAMCFIIYIYNHFFDVYYYNASLTIKILTLSCVIILGILTFLTSSIIFNIHKILKA